MSIRISEPLETLLGRHLLGLATKAEYQELLHRSQASESLRGALELLELSRTEFDHSPLGGASAMDPTHLPEFSRPEQLGRSLLRWNRIGSALAIVAMAVLLGLAALGLGLLDTGLGSPQLAGFAALGFLGLGVLLLVISLRRSREPYAGASWSELMAQLERQRKRYQGPRATLAIATAAAVSVVLLILSGFVSEPLETGFAYASFGGVAFAVHVAVRRWRLRTIAGA